MTYDSKKNGIDWYVVDSLNQALLPHDNFVEVENCFPHLTALNAA